jgi:hypothetical protein
MMRYTVTWRPDALEELARLWVEAENRAEIARASDQIDSVLAVDPEKAGKSVAEGLLLLTVRPLSVQFMIESQDCRVVVLSARLTN